VISVGLLSLGRPIFSIYLATLSILIPMFQGNIRTIYVLQDDGNLGAVEITTFFSMVLYGLLLSQGYTFFQRSEGERFFLKLFVSEGNFRGDIIIMIKTGCYNPVCSNTLHHLSTKQS